MKFEPTFQFDWFDGWQTSNPAWTARQGVTLLDALNALPLPQRLTQRPLRLALQDVYKVGGAGVVPVGKVWFLALCRSEKKKKSQHTHHVPFMHTYTHIISRSKQEKCDPDKN